jgi:two-component system chemotaxis response regulator CheY
MTHIKLDTIEEAIEAVKNGVSNYIVKPFTGATLQEKLAKVFATKKVG